MKSDFWCLANQAGCFPEVVSCKKVFGLPRLEIVSSRIKSLGSMGLFVDLILEHLF